MPAPQKSPTLQDISKNQNNQVNSQHTNKTLAQSSLPEQQLHRLFSVTACRTQAELADYLRLSVHSVRNGIKKVRGGADIPSSWLVALSRVQGVPPEWVLTGSGPNLIVDTNNIPTFPNATHNHYSSNEFLQASPCAQEALRHFSTQILLSEILYRDYSKTILIENQI
ncbi:MAG: helix-turn-helix domain-containing protein [Pseudomonadota bacterium]